MRGVDLEVSHRGDLRLSRAQRGRQVDDRAHADDAADDHRRSRRGCRHRRRPRPGRGAPADRRRAPGGRASTRARPAASCSPSTGGCSGSTPLRPSERAQQLLELVELEDAADRVIKGYSGGMQRRLDLAAALVHEPEVLFLDEPTTGLDPASRLTVWEELRRINAGGDDDLPDHAVPRGGRPALRPAGDHRRRPDRPRGHPEPAQGRPARASRRREEPTLDDVFLDATGRTRDRAAGEVQEVAA